MNLRGKEWIILLYFRWLIIEEHSIPVLSLPYIVRTGPVLLLELYVVTSQIYQIPLWHELVIDTPNLKVWNKRINSMHFPI